MLAVLVAYRHCNEAALWAVYFCLDMIEKYGKKLYIVLGVLVLIVLFLILSNKNKSGSRSSQASVITKPKAIVKIDKNFDFNAVNKKAEKKSINFSVVSVERKDEIRVKGVVKRSSEDRDYLLIRLELNNGSTEKLAITPSDFIRLEVNGKLFAPDYHNGRIIIEPLSVKKDLVSFVVDSAAKNFSFLVGELDKEKEKVQVKF